MVRNFVHNEHSLPILYLNTGIGYFQAFFLWNRQIYHNAVHFAFSLVHSVILEDIMSPLKTHAKMAAPVMPDSSFSLGQEVLFLDGEGVQKQVVYERATPDGQWHTLRKGDGSKVVTPGSYVRLLDQPTISQAYHLRHW
jgi:hypothetical protein